MGLKKLALKEAREALAKVLKQRTDLIGQNYDLQRELRDLKDQVRQNEALQEQVKVLKEQLIEEAAESKRLRKRLDRALGPMH